MLISCKYASFTDNDEDGSVVLPSGSVVLPSSNIIRLTDDSNRVNMRTIPGNPEKELVYLPFPMIHSVGGSYAKSWNNSSRHQYFINEDLRGEHLELFRHTTCHGIRVVPHTDFIVGDWVVPKAGEAGDVHVIWGIFRYRCETTPCNFILWNKVKECFVADFKGSVCERWTRIDYDDQHDLTNDDKLDIADRYKCFLEEVE